MIWDHAAGGFNAKRARPHDMPSDLAEFTPADAPTGRVGVILVNWNGWRDTAQALERLKRSRHQNWELFVVDNASTDESRVQLRGLDARLRLLESELNLGFAGGCNLGIRAARDAGADYFYFLNNDAFVDESTIERLVAASNALDDQAVLGSVIRFEANGSLQFWGSRKSKDWGGPTWFPGSEELFRGAEPLIESDFIMGASLFVPASVLDRVGEFDDRFFLNFEETDWCYRARALGHRCVVVKDAVVYHKGGASMGPGGPLQIYFMRRNRLLFCEKHCRPSQFAFVYLRQASGSVARFLLSLMARSENASKLRLYCKINLLATWHYSIRRFGNCPPKIRRIAAAHP